MGTCRFSPRIPKFIVGAALAGVCCLSWPVAGRCQSSGIPGVTYLERPGPPDPADLLRAATSAFSAGQFASAAEAYGRLAESFPNSDLRGEAAYWQGESLYNLGRFAEAAAAYERARQYGLSEKTAPFALYSIGRAYSEARQHAAAAVALESFLTTYRDSPLRAECIFLLANALAAGGDSAGAERRYLDLVEQYPESEFAARAEFALGDIVQRRGDFAAARERFERVAARRGPDSRRASLRAADCLYLLGDHSSAAAAYAAFPAGSPEYRRAQYGLALCREAQGRFDQARAILLALAGASEEPAVAARAALRLADDALRGGDEAGARRWYTLARDRAGEPSVRDEAELGLAVIANRERHTQANVDLALEVATRNAGSDLAALALYQAAVMSHGAGEYALAQMQAQASLSARPAGPTAPDALLLIGQCRLQLGERAGAIEAWQRVLTQHPYSAAASAAHGSLVAAYLAAGATAEALSAARAYRNALPTDPGLPDALRDVARALREGGSWQEARRLCADALAAGASGETAAQARYEMALCELERATGAADASDRLAALAAAWSALIQAEAETRDEALKEALTTAELRVGELSFSAEAYGTAQECYSHLLEAHPSAGTTPVARYKLAWCLLRTQRKAEALEQFRAAITADQDPAVRADARYQAAELLVERGDDAGAAELLEPLLTEPASPPLATYALTLLGRTALRLGKPGQARAAFEAAVDGLDDATVPLAAVVGLATAQRQLGDCRAAVATLTRALGLSQGDSAVQARLQLADCYKALGEPLQAAAQYDSIAADSEGETAAAALLEAAKLYRQRGNEEAAKVRFTKILTQYPDVQPYAQQARARLGEPRP